MQNGIIIPLSGAFISGDIGPAATDTQLDIDNMTWVANGTPSITQASGDITTTGSSTDLVVTVTTTGGSKTGTLLTFTAGTGVKVGDVITISQTSGAQFTGTIVLTVIEEDLLGDESEGFIASPGAGGFWNCVFPPEAGDSFNILYISQIESGHERDWKITITGGSADNHNDVAVAFDKAMVKAAQRPNENITVTGLPAGVKVSKVELT
jgi:hypothetical protein|tara:strand:- start:865 stop:1491 length:627 start_codon:yes stop_codon:yes gene_type:complete